VHTNDPVAVLANMTGVGEVAEVHIHNMRRQSQDRDEILAAESPVASQKPQKPIGFVAVAAGSGLAEILTSLGVDVVVSGGQTMNPSTSDLLAAIDAVPADKVLVLPNNKNILMAANAAASVSTKSVAVVATTAIPQAFAAMLAWDGSDDLDANAASMLAAAEEVLSGEVTTAVKDAKGKVGAIKGGQVIGIADHEIEVVGDDVEGVAADLATVLLKGGGETLTLLAGEDMTDDALERLAARIAGAHPDVDVETHRGEQPLYNVLLSAE